MADNRSANPILILGVSLVGDEGITNGWYIVRGTWVLGLVSRLTALAVTAFVCNKGVTNNRDNNICVTGTQAIYIQLGQRTSIKHDRA